MTGREEYAKARAAALRQGRKPRDPQQADGLGGDVQDAARELLRPCATCGCPKAMHHLTEPSGEYPRGRRTYCTIATQAGRCGCEEYAPAKRPDPAPAAIVPSDPD